MAGLARRTGRQMVRRPGHRRHSVKTLAVVAARTAAEDAQVVHHPRVKTGYVMADPARLRRRQMVGRHWSSRRRRKSRRRSMAGLAWRTFGINMVDRF